MNTLFYRNVRAHSFLEVFLFSAVSSFLLLRFYLYLAGYPQVGHGSLHIAHMLWGGLLMLVALVISLSFLGQRVKWIVSVLGGVGFGIFIDELGKFITKNNNYFFKPTIGIIYALFVSIYLLISFLSRNQKLTSEEYQLNALMELEEAIAQNLDIREKARVKHLLTRADQNNVITNQLQILLNDLVAIKPPKPGLYKKFIGASDKNYKLFWHRRRSSSIVRTIFVLELILFLAGVLALLYNNINSVLSVLEGHATYSRFLVVGQLISSLVAGAYVLYGIFHIQRSRLAAFEAFRKAILIDLLLTQFFFFSRQQFKALPGFAFNLLILILINFVLQKETHLNNYIESKSS